MESEYFITTVSVFAVAAFRLLPAFNRITGYMSRIMFNRASVNAVYEDLIKVEELERNQKQNTIIEDREIEFGDKIELEDISFRYPNVEEKVLEKISMSIPKNKSVAFVGASGAGKTTLAGTM